ncbi:MAG TPA: hypothetical protein VFV54_11015, partial [Thermoanaerobaculia bacterium]|nr:hypothetical protein [Thermoanaerobaculia bacterium]
IALLAAIAVGSMLALAEEQGIARRATLRLWPLIALAPPFLFYAVRIWPEAPGALCLSEAMRAAGRRKYARLALWLLALSLLQLRFMAIAATFALIVMIHDRASRKLVLILAAVIAVPLVLGFLVVGNPLQVHQWSELRPAPMWKYARGIFGLLLDAQAGLLFQAPVWFAAIVGAAFSVLRSPFSGVGGRDAPPTPVLRFAMLAAIPYLILLVPREEWHGGWSPPLRYLVVFAPLVAILAGRVLERSRAWFAPAAIWTALLAVHGVAFPWRLFHIANGESVPGEWLSVRFGSDFSRLFPSLIRPNGAAWAGAVLLVVSLIVAHLVRRVTTRPGAGETPAPHHRATAFVAGIALTLFFAAGLRPGSVVHFEDAHVDHSEGLLDPETWTVARFRFTGGWRLGEGESLRFRMQPGPAVIHVRAEHGGSFEIDGRAHEVPATGAEFVAIPTSVQSKEAVIRVTRGALTFDRVVRGK